MKDKLVNKNINQINIQQKKKYNQKTNYNDIKINEFSKNSNNININTIKNEKDEDATEENNVIKTEYNNDNYQMNDDNNNNNNNNTHPSLKKSTSSNKSFCKYIYKNQNIAETLKKSFYRNSEDITEDQIKYDENDNTNNIDSIKKSVDTTNKNITSINKVLVDKNNKNLSPKSDSKPIVSIRKNKKINKNTPDVNTINTIKNKIKPSDKKNNKMDNATVKKKSNDKIGESKSTESSVKSKNNSVKFDKKIVKIDSKTLKDKFKLNSLTKTQHQSLSKLTSKASIIEIKNPREEHIHSASSFYSTTTTSSSSSSLSSYSKSLNQTQLEIHKRFKKMKQEKLNKLQNNNTNNINNNNNNNNNNLNDTEANYESDKYKSKNDKNKKSNVVNLSISTLTGQQFTLKVLSSYTISDVKDLIQEKEGISSQTQILIYQDKTLDCDSMTLEDYGIENGASMRLIIKLYDGK